MATSEENLLESEFLLFPKRITTKVCLSKSLLSINIIGENTGSQQENICTADIIGESFCIKYGCIFSMDGFVQDIMHYQ